MRKILIVNDDGIRSAGIRQLALEAKKYGEVWVVAPESERSAMSHRITFQEPVDVWERPDYMEQVRAFACSGSPADCVRIGIELMGQKPDVVLSGINHGYNIGADTQYSATVGAALEASFWGIHAIAFSRLNVECKEVADKYMPELLAEYIDQKLPTAQVWNINFPGCTLAECRGVMRDCIVSPDKFYTDTYTRKIMEDGHVRYQLIPGRVWEASEGTDQYAVANGYVSVGIVHNIY